MGHLENIQKVRNRLIKRFGSKEKMLFALFPDFQKPKCSCCEIELEDLGNIILENGEIKYKKPYRKACLKKHCYSSTILVGSKEYREKVIGVDPAYIEKRLQERSIKANKTKKDSGLFDDPTKNVFSKKYWINKGYSEEEAKEILIKKANKAVDTKRSNGFFDDLSNNPFSKEFWKKQGLSEDEAKAVIESKNHNCAKYWIKRGYTEEEAILQASLSADVNSKTAIARRYGEDKVEEIFTKRSENQSAKWNIASAGNYNFGSSKAAISFFIELEEQLVANGFLPSDMLFQKEAGSKEWYISTKEHGVFMYDFCLLPKQILVEYNGEHVHPRKEKLLKEQWDKWQHAFSKSNADTVYQQDELKQKIANQHGWKVLYVWSKDDKANRKKEIQNILTEILRGN